MRYRRLRPGNAARRQVIGLAFLVAIGCSPQEDLKPDPGVSPFYPGPSADGKTPTVPSLAGPVAERTTSAAPDSNGPIRPEDVERQLRIAMRAAEKGDLARASSILDRILAVEPANREALLGRATVALTLAQKVASPDEKLAALDKAAGAARAIRSAYERPNQKELELTSRIHYEQIHTLTKAGRIDAAIAILKEVHEARFDPFGVIEKDPELAKLRESAAYKDLVKAVDAEKLAQARIRVKDDFARAPNFTFDFTVKDLDGKTLSHDQFKGKVLLVDLWGTWCKPCRDTIPGLIRLYDKYRARGLEVIGLDFEKDTTDPEKTRAMVKRFIKDSGINYPIAPLDDATREKIPNLEGYPTTLIRDRTGKVRIGLTGGGPDALAVIEAAIEVLVAEPQGKPTTPTPAAAAPPTGKAAVPTPKK